MKKNKTSMSMKTNRIF